MDKGELRPDTKMRGGLKMDGTGVVYNCFNCGFKTRYIEGEFLSSPMKYFMGKLGIGQTEIERIGYEIAKEIRNGLKSATGEVVTQFRIPQFKKIDLPHDAKPISHWASLPNPSKDFVEVAQYLLSRGIHIFNRGDYYWSPVYKHNMHHRIILPYRWKGDVVGWTARYVRDDKKTLKYLKESPPDYLFNHEVIFHKNRKYIIVVEGEFDAIAIDGVSTLGRKMSKAQASWLRQSGKEVIVVGDREFKDMNLVDFAIEYGFSASFPIWDEKIKDVADAVTKYGRIYTLKTILDSIERNKFSIKMFKQRKVATRRI